MVGDADWKAVKATYKWTLWLFGALAAAPGLISFVQKLFNFGLEPLFADFLLFYRACADTLIDALGVEDWPIIGFVDPWWLALYFDVLPFSLLLAGVVVRAIGMAERKTVTALRFAASIVWAIVLGLSGLGLAIAFVMMLLMTALLIPMIGIVLVGDAPAVVRDGYRPGPENKWRMVQAFLDNFLFRASLLMWLTFAATGAAVLVFFMGNLLSKS